MATRDEASHGNISKAAHSTLDLGLKKKKSRLIFFPGIVQNVQIETVYAHFTKHKRGNLWQRFNSVQQLPV